MIRRRELATRALQAALRVRSSEGLGIWDAICVYDLAERKGIEVRFVDAPSMEGLYHKGPKPSILISSHRPIGRQTFTCGHELGHHIFNHGTRVDELLDQTVKTRYLDPDEFIADCFAGFLLMPKSAVMRAFTIRGLTPSSCTPTEMYATAGWFGVGYATLIHHMRWALGVLSSAQANALLKCSPKYIRSSLLGEEIAEDLFLVDTHWTGRAIDIQVGDRVLVPKGSQSEGRCIRLIQAYQKDDLFVGQTPGIGRLYHTDAKWSAYVRVSRRHYVGRCLYRHLEDPDDV